MPAPPLRGAAPPVVAVVPARNEADVVGDAVGSLLRQTYPGPFHVVLVDDASDDGTAEAARRAASHEGRADRLTVIVAPPLAAGWTGKLWAVEAGLAEAGRVMPDAAYVLLTDADIRHGADHLAGLVARAEAGGLDLVSVMARLRCTTPAERLLMPAYVFFFAMLYPFAWVRDPADSTAAAAGGSMLVRRDALARIGGIAAIQGALIDDCALAARIKPGGPIWLALADRCESLRGYPRRGDVWDLVARSAYTQLRHSPAFLVLTVLGMGLVYLVPPALALTAEGAAASLGWVAWAAMSAAYAPMLRHFGRSVLWAPLLPLVALFYVGATVASAWRHARGRGGAWKGRIQAPRQR